MFAYGQSGIARQPYGGRGVYGASVRCSIRWDIAVRLLSAKALRVRWRLAAALRSNAVLSRRAGSSFVSRHRATGNVREDVCR